MIGKEFGGISGARITHMLKKVKDRLARDRKFEALFEFVEENLILKG